MAIKKSFIISLFFVSLIFANDNVSSKPIKKPRDMKEKLAPGYGASARTDVRGAWDFFVSGSFIYWQAIQETMQLAINNGDSTSSVVLQRTYDMNFDWHPGFKVIAGMNFDHDDWALFATYTRLHLKNSASYAEPVSSSISPYWISKVSQIYDFWASWYLHLDNIDLDLARKLHLGQKLLVTPHFGIRLALIDQKYYMNGKSYNSTQDIFFHPYSRVKSNSWGLGPKIGIDTNWHFTENLSFIANTNGAILYTSYKVKDRSYNLYYQSSYYRENRFDWKRKYLRPMVEFACGFSWERYFADDFWHFELSALYEFHILWNQNIIRSSINTYDLYLNGLTITAKLDF